MKKTVFEDKLEYFWAVKEKEENDRFSFSVHFICYINSNNSLRNQRSVTDALIKYIHNKRKFTELSKPMYIDLKCFSFKAKLTKETCILTNLGKNASITKNVYNKQTGVFTGTYYSCVWQSD